MGERHVVPDRAEGTWKVLGASTGASESTKSTQAEAVEEACAELARLDGGEVLIHGLAGGVQNKRTVEPSSSGTA